MIKRFRTRPSLFHGTITLLVVAGFVLRVWGNQFGLPFLYHEDEGEIVRRALRMPIDGPSPGWFQYPTLAVYVQAAFYAVLWIVTRLTGASASYGAFADAATLDPTSVYTLGRTVTAAFGAATIAVVGAAGRRFASFNRTGRDLAGIVAAALVTVELLQVEHGHYVTADVPMTLAAAGALLGVARLASAPGGGTAREYAVAGALVGIAASFKYPGALFAVAILAVAIQRFEWRSGADRISRWRDRRLPVAGFASVAAFVAGSPYVLLDWRTFVRDLGAEAAHMREGHLGFELVQNHWAEMFANVVESGNVALLALAVAGASMAVVRRDVLGRTLVVTLATLALFAASSNVLFARYLIPMLPVAALLGAHAIVAISGVLSRRRAGVRPVLVAVALIAVLSLPAWLVAHRLALFSAADTRTEAWTWVNTVLRRPGDRIAVEWKSIPRRPVRFDVAESSAIVYDVAQLRADGIEYVAVTDRLYRRYLRAPDLYPQQAAFYLGLLTTAEPVASFSPFADDHGRLELDGAGVPVVRRVRASAPWSALTRRERSGPVILVFRLRPQIDTETHRSDQ